MRIAMCSMEMFDNREKDTVGSSRIRARWLIDYWNNLYDDEISTYKIGHKYDALIFQKVYWENMVENFKGIKVIDLCDPDWLEGRDVMRYVNACDYCTTSTEPLAEYIRKFVTIPVKCIPDRIYLPEHLPRGEHMGKAKKIVWFGYSQNAKHLYKTLEVLKDFGLELIVISDQTYVPPTGFDIINITNHKYAYPLVNEIIKECDLYLSPERTDERGKFKSNNKDLQCMALGVPVVRTPDDLERLVKPDERNKQMAKDLKEIEDKWDVKYSVMELKEILNEVDSKKV